MKTKHEQLKLIRWFDDGRPPINLTKEVGDVIKLIEEIRFTKQPAQTFWSTTSL